MDNQFYPTSYIAYVITYTFGYQSEPVLVKGAQFDPCTCVGSVIHQFNSFIQFGCRQPRLTTRDTQV